MGEGLVSKLINSGVMTLSTTGLSIIVFGSAALLLSGGNDKISWAGIYAGAGVGAVAGLLISYITYRDY